MFKTENHNNVTFRGGQIMNKKLNHIRNNWKSDIHVNKIFLGFFFSFCQQLTSWWLTSTSIRHLQEEQTILCQQQCILNFSQSNNIMYIKPVSLLNKLQRAALK